MENGEIKSDKVKLVEIFSEKFWFVIPEYQRSYVWENDNIMELLDDLFFAYENKPENGIAVFMSSDGENPAWQVIPHIEEVKI